MGFPRESPRTVDRIYILEVTVPFGNGPLGLKIRGLRPSGLQFRLLRETDSLGHRVDDLVHVLPFVVDLEGTTRLARLLRDDEHGDLRMAGIRVGAGARDVEERLGCVEDDDLEKPSPMPPMNP